jgi:pyroglutamyl-peptidase
LSRTTVPRVALLTGFEPYGGLDRNPSAEVVKQLDGAEIEGHRVVGRILPVSFGPLRRRIRDLLQETDPVAVVSLGLCPGEPVIRLERVAVNIADFAIPDNEGTRLADDVVAPEGPTALQATLPLRAIERALLRAGIPARLSTTAGTFLCNATLYTVLEAEQAAGVPSGFVHLPYLAEQVARLCEEARAGKRGERDAPDALASMSLGTMVDAARIILEVSLEARPRLPASPSRPTA